MKWLGLGVLLVATSAGRSLSAAEPCAPKGAPYVVVEVPSASVSFGQSVLEQLRAGLRSKHIFVCARDEAPPEPPIARVVLASRSPQRVVVSVEVADALTQKKLARDVDLSTVPEDARPLTLALAAGEALRASWAELALSTAPRPKRRVPREVRVAVHESLAPGPERLPSLSIGAAFAGEWYAAGQHQLGIDARFALFFGPVVFARARAGLRSAADVASEHGTIHSRALAFALGPGVALTPRGHTFGVDALLDCDVTRVKFVGSAVAGARGRSVAATAVYVRGALAGWFAPDPMVRISLGLSSGVPARSAVVDDGSSSVSGLDGVLLGASLGFGGQF